MRRLCLATRIGIPLALLLQPACTWVPLTRDGERVRVLGAAEAGSCEKLGRTTSRTADRVLIFARVERTVTEELRSLAQNEAAEMGGDAIVPVGVAEQGRQSFDVYRCGGR